MEDGLLDWTPEVRSLVESIDASEDTDFVLSFLKDARYPVRMAVARWFSLGPVPSFSWAPVLDDLPPQDRVMPSDVATTLINDVDVNVAFMACMRTFDGELLANVALDEGRPTQLSKMATSRLVSLGLLHELFKAGTQLTVGARQGLAASCDSPVFLEEFLDAGDVDDLLLRNPNLNPSQVLALSKSLFLYDVLSHPNAPASLFRKYARGFEVYLTDFPACPGEGSNEHTLVADRALSPGLRLHTCASVLGDYSWRLGDLAHVSYCFLPLVHELVSNGEDLDFPVLVSLLNNALETVSVVRFSGAGGQQSTEIEARVELVRLADLIKEHYPSKWKFFTDALNCPPEL